MDQIIALPIKGESFLLRRGDRVVLVDGGWSGKTLAAALAVHAANVSKIDVVVCTHADGDHATGLADFLNHWRVSLPDGTQHLGEVGQFWLPGAWVDVLPKVLQEPRKLKVEIIKALDDFVAQHPTFASNTEDHRDIELKLEELIRTERWQTDNKDYRQPDLPIDADQNHHDEFDLNVTEPLDEPDWFKALRDNVNDLFELNNEAEKAFRSCRRSIRRRQSSGKIGEPLAAFWMQIVDALPLIRKIALSAMRRNIRIRWFDYDGYLSSGAAKGGVRDFLVPLNAVEQAPTPRSDIALFARLSPVNEASLTFMAPPEWNRLGVVFCGDSPLGHGLGYKVSFLSGLPGPDFPVIATAPHHGAESNRIAYDHLQSWAEVMIWLRTGGGIKQPGVTFKGMQFPRRLCSHCPQSGKPLQLAGVSGYANWGSNWPPLVKAIALSGHNCSCP